MNLLFIFLLLLPIIILSLMSSKEGYENIGLNIADDINYSLNNMDELGTMKPLDTMGTMDTMGTTGTMDTIVSTGDMPTIDILDPPDILPENSVYNIITYDDEPDIPIETIEYHVDKILEETRKKKEKEKNKTKNNCNLKDWVLKNGSKGNCGDTLEHTKSCKPICNKGFSLNKKNITCNKKNISDIKCIYKKCNPLSVKYSQNNKIISQKICISKHGEKCSTYKCPKGYSIDGKGVDAYTYTCNADGKVGKWESGDTKISVPDSKKPKEIIHKCMPNVCYRRKINNKMIGGTTIKNTMENTTLNKLQNETFPTIRSFKNGITTCNGKGDCFFQCSNGYTPYVDSKEITQPIKYKNMILKNTAKVTCTNKGYQEGVCKESKCKLKNNLKTGDCKNKTSINPGERCNLKCKKGEIITINNKQVNGTTFECKKGAMFPLSNMSQEGGNPKCGPIVCKKPKNPNGYEIPNNISLLQEKLPVSLKCSKGYFGKGIIDKCESHQKEAKLRGCTKFYANRKKEKETKMIDSLRLSVKNIEKTKDTKLKIQALDSKINEIECYLRPQECYFKNLNQ